jgi:hypothetical protein
MHRLIKTEGHLGIEEDTLETQLELVRTSGNHPGGDSITGAHFSKGKKNENKYSVMAASSTTVCFGGKHRGRGSGLYIGADAPGSHVENTDLGAVPPEGLGPGSTDSGRVGMF